MKTVIVTSSKELIAASSQPETTPGRIKRQRDPAEHRGMAGPERDRGVLDALVDAVGGGQHEPEREGQHHDDVAQHQAEEGAGHADLREEAQEGDAEHDMGHHQRRHEQRRQNLAAGKAIARDGERGGYGKHDRDRRGQGREPERVAEGADEFGIVEDRLEPAQARAARRQREIALGREGDDADDQQRRQHEDDESAWKQSASGPFFSWERPLRFARELTMSPRPEERRRRVSNDARDVSGAILEPPSRRHSCRNGSSG
jgi:hypothetical protein